MRKETLRRLLLASTLVLALGLPLSLLALLMLFNPYAIGLSTEFTVVNGLDETVEVTPMAVVHLASGERFWRVVPQLAVPYLAAPPRREAAIPVAPGEAVAIRGNFDDVSLAAIAVETAGQPVRMLIVDPGAALGGCCYAPKTLRIAISNEALEPGSQRLADAVAYAKSHSRALDWWLLAGSGLAVGVLFILSLRAWPSVSRRPGDPA